MKPLLLICISLFFVYTAFSQSRQVQPQEQNYAQWIYVEYEIKGLEHPDPVLLNQLPFETYNQQRLESQDLEIQDAATGWVVVLYSEEKCAFNKQQ